jgi:cell division protein FtsN
MPKDYKNRIPAYRRGGKRATETWRMAGTAVAGIAGLVALSVYVFSGSEREPGDPAPVTVPAPPPRGVARAADLKPDEGKKTALPENKAQTDGKTDRTPKITPQEPRFTFYKILAEKEVIIPESEIKSIKREESLGKPPETGVYMLQAGSFTKPQDAERLKAQLAQIRINAKLEMIKLDNATWYRVKVGPYATLADADKVRQYLRGNKIDSIVQKATQ